MVVSNQVEPFFQWLFFDTGDGRSALGYFFWTALAVVAVVLVCAYLVAAFRHGPLRGAKLIIGAIAASLKDFLFISPRRVFGLATLAVREAMRRHIWVGLVLFLILIAFTGWFLDPTTDQPAKLYISWVIRPATWLMLVLALYLSSLSLPSDIKSRTIYTVVTKPVRASEIILGRILGFSFACTVMLAIMGGVGYFFILRALSHTHVVETEEVEYDASNEALATRGTTSMASGHRHQVRIPVNAYSPGVELQPGTSGALTISQLTSTAQQAGAQKGDVVTAIDGEPVADLAAGAADNRLSGPAGSTVKLTVSRNGQPHEITLTRLATRAQTEMEKGHRHEVIARYSRVDFGADTAVEKGRLTISKVTRDSAAARAGLQRGDVIVSVDGQPVDSREAMESHLYASKAQRIALIVQRVEQQKKLQVDRGTLGKLQYEVGPAEGMLAARVPIYGTLRFRDPQGNFRRKGISVGKLFGYRSYIQGNTLAAAVWTFEGLNPEDFPDGLPLDLDIRVYRMQKGKVEQGITGKLWLRNPQTGLRSQVRTFTAREFRLDHQFIPRKLAVGDDPVSQAVKDDQGRLLKTGPIDLFEHLTSRDGAMEVWIQCAEPGQSFGMARADVYVRGRDASFTWNYCKAIFEIWLQVVLVTSLAVMFSSFLSGPVAILVTITAIVMGFSTHFVHNLTNSVIYREEMNIIETVRQFANQNQLDLEREGAWRVAQRMKEAGQLGPDAPDIQALLAASTAEDEQKRQQLLAAIRSKAAASRIDLEAEGIARTAQTLARQGRYEMYDEHRLDQALRQKVDQVDVLDRVWGGGPIEAFYRLITQNNLTSDLDSDRKAGQPPSLMTRTIHLVDDLLMRLLQAVSHVLPDFRRFSDADYLANGYNIHGSLVGQHAAATLGFSLAAFVAGYFCLKYREVAR